LDENKTCKIAEPCGVSVRSRGFRQKPWIGFLYGEGAASLINAQSSSSRLLIGWRALAVWGEGGSNAVRLTFPMGVRISSSMGTNAKIHILKGLGEKRRSAMLAIINGLSHTLLYTNQNLLKMFCTRKKFLILCYRSIPE